MRTLVRDSDSRSSRRSLSKQDSLSPRWTPPTARESRTAGWRPTPSVVPAHRLLCRRKYHEGRGTTALSSVERYELPELLSSADSTCRLLRRTPSDQPRAWPREQMPQMPSTDRRFHSCGTVPESVGSRGHHVARTHMHP